MNWEAIGAIGEICGAIAVVVTLIYLTLQLKQNSLQIRLNSSQVAATTYSNRIIAVLSDPTQRTVFRGGLESFLALAPDDQAQFHSIMLGFRMSFDQNKQLFDEGVISEDLFKAWEEDWIKILKCPGAWEWWELTRNLVGVQAGRYIDDLVAASDQLPLNEVVPFLRTA